MAKPLRYFLTEALTPRDFDQLRKDAGAFTKNIRRISNGRELAIVMEAFAVWQHHYQEMVYAKLLGLGADGSNGGYNFNNEPWAAKNLREKAWGLRSESPFTLFIGYGSRVREEWLKQNKRFVYTDKLVSQWDGKVWDMAYRVFDEKRESRYQKLGKLIRDAFKALDEYFESNKQDSYLDQAVRETTIVDGIPVHVFTKETIDSTVEIKKGLAAIRAGIQSIRQKGLGAGLRRLSIELRPESHDWETAGHYTGYKDSITLHAFGLNPHTVVHEVGHHFFQTALSEENQARWSAFIRNHVVRFDEADYRIIKTAFHQALERIEQDRQGKFVGYTYGEQFWANYVPTFITSRDTLTKFQHFSQTQFGKHDRSQFLSAPWTPDSQHSNDDRWTEFLELSSKGFVADVPTAYSNKNPEEAFCEVFAFYVTGKKLADIMRCMLRDVTGLG